MRSAEAAETERLLSQGREEIMAGHDLNFSPMLGDSVGFMSLNEVRHGGALSNAGSSFALALLGNVLNPHNRGVQGVSA